jgi:hypothetical protein
VERTLQLLFQQPVKGITVHSRHGEAGFFAAASTPLFPAVQRAPPPQRVSSLSFRESRSNSFIRASFFYIE